MRNIFDKTIADKVNEVVDFVNTNYCGDDNRLFYEKRGHAFFFNYKKDGLNDRAYIFNNDYLLICVENNYFFAIEDDGYFCFNIGNVFNSINDSSALSIVELASKMHDFVATYGIKQHIIANNDYMLDEPVFSPTVCGFALGVDLDKRYVEGWTKERPDRLNDKLTGIEKEIKHITQFIKSVNKKLNNKKFQEYAMDAIKAHEKEKLDIAEKRLMELNQLKDEIEMVISNL